MSDDRESDDAESDDAVADGPEDDGASRALDADDRIETLDADDRIETLDADDRIETLDADDRIESLVRAYALKDETRTGWALRGVADPESVAAHTWGVCLLVLQFAPEGVDVDRALRMALVHDLAEAEVGDVAVRAEAGARALDDDEKARREREAMADLAGPLGEDVRELWEAYEAARGGSDAPASPTARFVTDADLLDMCLQALVYEREGRYDPDADNPHFEAYDDLDEFFATAESRLSTDVGRRLFEAVRARYEAAKDRR